MDQSNNSSDKNPNSQNKCSGQSCSSITNNSSEKTASGSNAPSSFFSYYFIDSSSSTSSPYSYQQCSSSLIKESFFWRYHIVFGWLFVSLVGSGCHFMYKASSCNWFVGWLVAVNESVYEHLKLLIFPMLVWWLFVLPVCLKWQLMQEHQPPATMMTRAMTAHVAAVCASITCGNLFIVIVFLLEHYAIGAEALWFDIITFVVGVMLGQYVGWRSLCVCDRLSDTDLTYWRVFILIVFAGLMAMYLTFTDVPPQVPDFVFRDMSNANATAWFYGRPLSCV